MALRETGIAAALRLAKLKMLQDHYTTFNTFLDDVMEHLGFETSWVQHDIGNWLTYGPDYLMVQAQRGQAKTTITAAFAVYSLIQNPKTRVLIVSAAGTTASDISTLIVRIIATMPQLECMIPDKSAGDKTSSENYDIHHTLKGVDKSASIACTGITGTLTSRRADLLIADDIESPKNSRTATNRELLLQLTREFSSLTTGQPSEGIRARIVYLGTPQSMDSVYNTLPGRGFAIRIWPGRYPTMEQRKAYGDMLAPSMIKRIEQNPALMHGGGLAGNEGQAIDDLIVPEEVLQKKYLDQGAASYQLQYMLNTELSDKNRYPLKTENLIVMQCNRARMPMAITRAYTQAGLEKFTIHNHNFAMAVPHGVSEDTGELQGVVMYVDPAGGGKNGDETGYAVTGFLNGNIYVLDVGGVPGGYAVTVMETLAEIAAKWKPNHIFVEKNMGFGAFKEVWTPILRKYWEGSIQDDMVHGQKERRIIDTLEPVMGRGALIINRAIVESDTSTTLRYEGGKRVTYSFFHQLAKITYEAGALVHDDRLDALEGAVRYWVPFLTIDEDKAAEAKKKAEFAAFMKDPFGHKRYTSGAPSQATSTLNRFRRF